MTLTAAEVRQRLAGHSVWVWHYLHPDWQWEQSRHWHEERYALAVSEALDIMQRNPEFCYFFDSTSEFYSAVAPRLGARLEELKQRVREGRVRLVSGQVANCRPTQVGDETYIRNIQLGREYWAAHLPPTDLSLFHSVDIAIGGVQMPQILSLAGFRYYRAWRPHGPMNVLGIPHQFIWQGIDGSRIIVTRGAYGAYGPGWEPGTPAVEFRRDWDATLVWLYEHHFRDQLLHDRSPSGQLWIIQGYDDARPQTSVYADQPLDMLGLVEEWRRHEDIPIRWCTPLEYSQAVAAHAEQLPVVAGVLDGADCAYNMANHGANGLWVWRQMNDRRLVRAECWSAAAQRLGFVWPDEERKRLWYQHCTYQAHAQDAAFEDDFNYLVDRARDVRTRAERVQEEALAAIVRAAGGGTRFTRYIFNPHPWPVEADVEVYHACVTAGVESVVALDDQDRELPQQQLAEFRHPRFGGSVNDERRLVRISLPPLGYRRIELAERTAPRPQRPPAPEDGTVETGALRLVYRGHTLREVQDKTNGATYSSREGGAWPGLYFHVLDAQDWLFAGPELRRERYVPQGSTWLQAGPLRWQHQSTGLLGPYRVWLDTTVADCGRELHVAVRLEGHWDEPPLTGFVSLLSDIEAGGTLTVDTPFAVEPRDPDHDIYCDNVPPGKDYGIADMFERLRPGVFWGRSWADWSARGQGLALISMDGSYYWFKEPHQFGHILLRCVARKPGTWEAFCPPSWGGSGVHRFSYALRFHDGDWRAADPQRRSLELRHPPVVARAECPGPALLPHDAHSFLHLEGPALLSAYYTEGDASILRIYEHTGGGGEACITLDWCPTEAVAVDLLAQTMNLPVRLDGQRVMVTLQPWQIATLRLRHG
jgi:hypothetical protein